MKMTKKTTALMLAMTLAAAGTTAAYGDPGVSDNGVVGSAGGSTNMTLTGNIQVTTLSVTIPTTVAFDVDMTKVPVKSATDKVGVKDVYKRQISYKEVPDVGEPMDESVSDTASERLKEEGNVGEEPASEEATNQEQPETNEIQLKAAIGSLTRNFTLNTALLENTRAVYETWEDVGEAVYNGTITGTNDKLKQPTLYI